MHFPFNCSTLDGCLLHCIPTKTSKQVELALSNRGGPNSKAALTASKLGISRLTCPIKTAVSNSVCSSSFKSVAPNYTHTEVRHHHAHAKCVVPRLRPPPDLSNSSRSLRLVFRRCNSHCPGQRQWSGRGFEREVSNAGKENSNTILMAQTST